MKPTVERLRELLHYDPAAGVFTWKKNRGGTARAGTRAGADMSNGYTQISVDNWPYTAHAVAWAWMTGEWPTAVIDHVNGDRRDNRWANLRAVDQSVNMRNVVAPYSSGSSGFIGVTRDRRSGRWRAQITAGYQNRHIGMFDTPEQASAAYWAAKAELHGVDSYAGRLA